MDLADDIRGVIAKVLKADPEKVLLSSKLSELGADSLDVVEMVFFIEEKYDVSLMFEVKEDAAVIKVPSESEEKIVQIGTVEDIVTAVQQVIGAKAN